MVARTRNVARAVNKQKEIAKKRQRRKFAVRKHVRGTVECPRMSVHRSCTHVSCQLIDDANGRTLVSASTHDESLRQQIKFGGNCDAAKTVGRAVAERALAAGIKSVRFDRGCYKYHGRVAALAQAAREVGLVF